jgi:hypothetical protein
VDFSGRKFICGITSKLLQIHQETLWRRPKNISNVAFTSSLSEERLSRKQNCYPFWIVAIMLAILSIVTLKLR